jgi:hypothetical protein
VAKLGPWERTALRNAVRALLKRIGAQIDIAS